MTAKRALAGFFNWFGAVFFGAGLHALFTDAPSNHTTALMMLAIMGSLTSTHLKVSKT